MFGVLCTSDFARTSDVQRHSTGMVRFTNNLNIKICITMMILKIRENRKNIDDDKYITMGTVIKLSIK